LKKYKYIPISEELRDKMKKIKRELSFDQYFRELIEE